MSESLPPTAVTDLAAVIGDGVVCAMNPDTDGVLYLAIGEARAEGDENERRVPGGWTSQGRPRPYRIVGLRDSSTVLDLVIHDVPLIVDYVDAQPDRLMLSGSRALGRNTWEEPHECNARVYLRDGQFVRALALGDDIMGMQSAADGALWVAYGAGSDSHIVPSDLVAFDAMGAPVYQFESRECGYMIGDTDALNAVGNGDIWLVSSPNDYTLLHLRLHDSAHAQEAVFSGAIDSMQGRARSPRNYRTVRQSLWNLPLDGTACFAVSGRYAMFSLWDSPSGKGTTHEINFYALQDYGQFEAIGQFTPVDAVGKPIEVQRCIGRGNAIYLLADRSLYRIDVETALAACGKSK